MKSGRISPTSTLSPQARRSLPGPVPAPARRYEDSVSARSTAHPSASAPTAGSGPLRIVVVGAGAAGSLVVFHLARLVAAGSAGNSSTAGSAGNSNTAGSAGNSNTAGSGGDRPSVDVTVVDPLDPVSGPAFGTADAAHLLNVPASGMSVVPGERFDFVTWCVDEGLTSPDDATYFFAPRNRWARYLRTRLDEARAAAGDRLRVTHVRSTATGISVDASGVRVTTADGSAVVGDRLVLATGLPGVGDGWSPCDLSDQPRYVGDPWRPGALDEVLADDGDVLVIGTGLTMVDVAISLLRSGADRRVEAISRNGRLPHRHADRYLGEVVPDIATWGESLDEIQAAVATHVARVERLLGNWRPGVDGVRYRVAELWGRLGHDDRALFVRELAGRWGIHRHRMPPSSGVLVDEARAAGRLVIRAGRITGVEPGPDGITIRTADDVRTHSWVVNCTGPQSDLRRLGNPVLDSLFANGLARTDALGLGLLTDGGQVLDADGRPGPMWALGSLRRGELWETTAVPEIREQARDVAESLLDDGRR
ncbi:oxidoreductase [Gordonia paraffinivorans]|nr:oxidoreductase [Gordonia paraffinivorans]